MSTDIRYPELKFYIDGQWTAGSGSATREVIDPADESVIGLLPMATAADLDLALAAAAKGFSQWRRYAPGRRAEILLEAAHLLRARSAQIAPLTTLEQGLPLAESAGYIQRGADFLEWDANEGRRAYGRVIPSEPGLRNLVVREPIGVVAAFSPWNAPIVTPCRKLGSALAAGCAIVLKAAEEAPATTMALVQAFHDAGVPPGVINLVYGDPATISAHLIAAPIVRLVTFTGSVPVGKHLARLAAGEMKPSIMELGGHAPVIVCEDADVEVAAQRTGGVKFRNAGQACIAPSRFFVHDAVYDRFVSAFAAVAAKIKVGSGMDPAVTMGPVSSARRLAAMQSLVDDALACGAVRVHGGRRIGERGWFFEPTVLGEVPDTARVMREEPFGPVAALTRFTDLEDAVGRANALPYGLAGYVFTRSAATASKLAERLECGAIGINHLVISTTGIPFGGVKDSGHGREGGSEGIAGYMIEKTITHLYD
ncbi:MAG: NAD-dependent succinate-semialdehyde dehydrogenase [Gammaproteobacteria bacterium]